MKVIIHFEHKLRIQAVEITIVPKKQIISIKTSHTRIKCSLHITRNYVFLQQCNKDKWWIRWSNTYTISYKQHSENFTLKNSSMTVLFQNQEIVKSSNTIFIEGKKSSSITSHTKFSASWRSILDLLFWFPGKPFQELLLFSKEISMMQVSINAWTTSSLNCTSCPCVPFVCPMALKPPRSSYRESQEHITS